MPSLSLLRLFFQPIHAIPLFLLDFTSLYTSILHTDGLKTVKYFLNTRISPSINTDTRVRLIELVLTLNSFGFAGEFFDQISGAAMGTKMGLSYACLFMGYLETQIQNTYQVHYYRYIDDGIGITTLSTEELNSYINFVKQLHPSISFTSVISATSVNFLDIKITLRDDSLHSSVYYKPTDSHSYLTYTSSHPISCKRSITCSLAKTIQTFSVSMRDFFSACVYPIDTLEVAWSRMPKVSSAQS